MLLGLSEKQKQRRFLSIFVIKKNVLVKMVSGFMNLLCLVVLVGSRVAHGAVCKKLDFFFKVKKCAHGPWPREEVLYTAAKVDRTSEIDVFYHHQRLG